MGSRTFRIAVKERYALATGAVEAAVWSSSKDHSKKEQQIPGGEPILY
jgi:hypothetical protein